MTTSYDRRRSRHRRRWALLALPAGAAGLAVLAACGSSGTSASSSGGSTPSASTSAAATASGLKTAKVGGVTVLTNAQGFTLYAFARDTTNKSACTGACATNWPPVAAPANASAVKAPFATITRAGGSTQLTIHGHPLYTFVGDTSPGRTRATASTRSAVCGTKRPRLATQRRPALRHRAAAASGTDPHITGAK